MLLGDAQAGQRGPARGVPAGGLVIGEPGQNPATGGHTAGRPTLAGLRIAKEHGWAPDDGGVA